MDVDLDAERSFGIQKSPRYNSLSPSVWVKTALGACLRLMYHEVCAALGYERGVLDIICGPRSR
jgi:hypothetical protein